MFNKKDILICFLIVTVYLFSLFFFKRQIFNYRFNPVIVNLYLNSQDIEGEVDQRVFISDEEIYLSSGYLYAQGGNPASYNLHPPLIKYLFGYSIKYLGNPYIVQIVFGALLLILTYLLGIAFFSKRLVSTLAVAFLLVDPLFINLSSQTLLDLGQAVFALGYVGAFVFLPESFLLQGIILGLFAASKFWTTAIFWFVFLVFYKTFILKQKISIKKTIYSLSIAVIVFSFTYLKTFLATNWDFNIFAYQARVLKFMLSHNSAEGVGGNLILFITGYFNRWWNRSQLLRGDTWSVLWPTSLVVNILALIKPKFSVKQAVVYLLPLAYFIFTVSQVPFTRYFILILPFMYLVLANELLKPIKLK